VNVEVEIINEKIRHIPCRGLPEVSTTEDSLEILTINRWIYLVHVGCAFRDLLRVMSDCQDQGMIGRVDINCTPSEYPNGMEWAAIVLPGGFKCMDIRPSILTGRELVVLLTDNYCRSNVCLK